MFSLGKKAARGCKGPTQPYTGWSSLGPGQFWGSMEVQQGFDELSVNYVASSCLLKALGKMGRVAYNFPFLCLLCSSPGSWLRLGAVSLITSQSIRSASVWYRQPSILRVFFFQMVLFFWIYFLLSCIEGISLFVVKLETFAFQRKDCSIFDQQAIYCLPPAHPTWKRNLNLWISKNEVKWLRKIYPLKSVTYKNHKTKKKWTRDLILHIPDCVNLFAEPLYSRHSAPGIHCKDEETRAKEKRHFPRVI